MAEYIERDKVYQDVGMLVIDNDDLTRYEDGRNMGVFNAMSVIEKAPAADVRPERHGEWVNLGGGEWGCSCCGHVISTEGSWEHPMSETQCNDYCRKCGAKMDGKDGESDENR